MSKTRLNSNMSDELYNMKKFATTVIATDVKENKEKLFTKNIEISNECINKLSDCFLKNVTPELLINRELKKRWTI